MTTLEIINKEIATELAKEDVRRALLATTFKGLEEKSMRQALLEGMIRGFTFQDFLEKNVYAIPYGQGYSLVTSIDYARKRGMRNGIVGVEAPVYEEQGDQIISCSVTVKRKIGDYIGDFTAKVYFNEFSSGKNLWQNKPRTMIAKVAEMHALRKACPEELAQTYTEEEFNNGSVIDGLDNDTQGEINNLKNLDELKTYYHANKGKGKAFDKAIQVRKKELESDVPLESDPTEPRVVPDPEA